MLRYLLKRILHPGKIQKVFIERLTEPLHLNFISIFVAILADFEQKSLLTSWSDNNTRFRSCLLRTSRRETENAA